MLIVILKILVAGGRLDERVVRQHISRDCPPGVWCGGIKHELGKVQNASI